MRRISVLSISTLALIVACTPLGGTAAAQQGGSGTAELILLPVDNAPPPTVTSQHVQIDGVHEYRLRTDGWSASS